MKYTIQSNNLIEFSEINIGELFIADGIPFIKVPEIRDEYSNDIYNCVRLDEGGMYHYYSYEHVKRPKNYELIIEM